MSTRTAVRGLVCALGASLALAGCAVPPPAPREMSSGHITTKTPPPPSASIPAPVKRAPFVPPPKPSAPVETYTVVVNEVPAKELLFALARDAKINVDVNPAVTGVVTLNAVDQTLQQILQRISRQIDVRYEYHGDTLVVGPDTPVLRTYRIDYVNMTRDTKATNVVATQLSTGSSTGEGGGGSAGQNNSTTTITSTSEEHFWKTLADSVRGLILGDSYRPVGPDGKAQALNPAQIVVANPDAGLLLVRATERQQRQVRALIDEMLTSARREVLVEATIVEVRLNDRYRAGIDWQKLALGAGISLTQAVITGATTTAAAPAAAFTLLYQNAPVGNPKRNVTIDVELLKQFGDVHVLSSPKLMVLNNQTATLKVVDNVVYFDITAQPTVVSNAGVSQGAVDTKARTVPIGLVMTVTPQISAADEVTLNVRPTVTRIIDFVQDPQPALKYTANGTALTNPIVNNVPEIAVREMESMLRLNSGQIAVLGGLMQDDNRRQTNGLPVLSQLRDVGDLFNANDTNYTKTELVVFLRPWVIRTPSVEADLRSFRSLLPENEKRAEPIKQKVELK